MKSDDNKMAENRVCISRNSEQNSELKKQTEC